MAAGCAASTPLKACAARLCGGVVQTARTIAQLITKR